jgi:hypothetical protein
LGTRPTPPSGEKKLKLKLSHYTPRRGGLNNNNNNNNNNNKCFVIPVIIGATEIVSKSLQKYLETIPGQHLIDSLQKTAILGTSHIIRKVLQAET